MKTTHSCLLALSLAVLVAGCNRGTHVSTGKGNVLHIATRVVELGARAGKPEKLLAAHKAMDAEPEQKGAEAGEIEAQQLLQLEAGL